MSEEQTGEEQIDEEVQVQPLVSLPDPNVTNAPIVAIRGQQAIGIPNIVSQTDKTNLDKIEMLYDPIAQQVQPDELLTEQGKYMDTSQQRQRVADPTLISGIQDVSVQDQDAAQIQNVERTFSNMITATAAKGTITENPIRK